MDWKLIYRSEADMMTLHRSMKTALPVDAITWTDATGSLAYLKLSRS